MKIIDVKLDTVCGYTSILPVLDAPEIAFAGKSNVGKSSLLNVLMKRRHLARVGETPGKTRTINFYRVLAEVPSSSVIGLTENGSPERMSSVSPDEASREMCLSTGADEASRETLLSAGSEKRPHDGLSRESEPDMRGTKTPSLPASEGDAKERKLRWKKDPARRKNSSGGSGRKTARKKSGQKTDQTAYRVPFFLVDLPGYGYASVAAQEKEKWGEMIERYLNSSSGLSLVFLLVDIRHDPNENDMQMMRWIRAAGFSPAVIATKADKIARGKIPAQVGRIRKILDISEDEPVVPFSAQSGQGAGEIYRVIAGRLR